MYYDELLKVCGFEPEEIEQERPRIERAFDKMEVGVEDCERGEETVRQFHGIDLAGPKKMRRLMMKDMIDMVLAKDEGKTVVFNASPNVPRLGALVALALPTDKFCYCSPDELVGNVMGGIFGKMNPIFEAAEASVLPSGLAHCPMAQVRLGMILKGMVSPPLLLISADDFCDSGPKIDEIISEMYGTHIIHTDCPAEGFGCDWPVVSRRRVEFLAGEFRRGIAKIEDVLGFHFSDAMVRDANNRFNYIYSGWQYASLLSRLSEPKAVPETDMTQFIRILTSITNRLMLEGQEAVDTFIDETQDRVARGIGLPEVPGGRRTVWTVLGSCMDLSWYKMLESEEIGLEVHGEIALRPGKEMLPSLEEDLFGRAADITLRHVTKYGGTGFVHLVKELCQESNLDGCILNYMFTCNMLRSSMVPIKAALERDLDTPTLLLEWEYIDKRDYNTESARTKVEAFAGLLRSRPKRRKPTFEEMLEHYKAVGAESRQYERSEYKKDKFV